MTIKTRELEVGALLKLKSIFANEREQVLAMEASYLLAKVLGISRQQLLISKDLELSAAAEKEFNNYIDRRCAYEPLAYILGEQEFFSLNFKVTKDVLIPRPETELLVEKALEALKQKGNYLAVVDICCGSGAILVSIAKTLNNPSIKYIGLDLSPAACVVARENASSYGLELKILESDLLAALGNVSQPILFVSNPPYIPDTQELMPDVENYEPQIALRGGPDGLDIIRRLLMEFRAKVEQNSNNMLLMEIGINQQLEVESTAQELKLKVLEVYEDFQRIPRIIKIGTD